MRKLTELELRVVCGGELEMRRMLCRRRSGGGKGPRVELPLPDPNPRTHPSGDRDLDVADPGDTSAYE